MSTLTFSPRPVHVTRALCCLLGLALSCTHSRAQSQSSSDSSAPLSSAPAVVIPGGPAVSTGGGNTGSSGGGRATQARQATGYTQPGTATGPFINQTPAIVIPGTTPGLGPASTPGYSPDGTSIAPGEEGAIDGGTEEDSSSGGKRRSRESDKASTTSAPDPGPRGPSAADQTRINRQSSADKAKSLLKGGPAGSALSVTKEVKQDVGPLMEGVALAMKRIADEAAAEVPAAAPAEDVPLVELDDDSEELKKQAQDVKKGLDEEAASSDEVNQDEQADEAEKLRQEKAAEEALRKKIPGRADLADKDDALDDRQAEADKQQSQLDAEREALEKDNNTRQKTDKALREQEQELRQRDPNCRSAECKGIQRERAANRQALNKNAVQQGKLDVKQSKASLEQRNISRERAEVEAKRDQGVGLTRDEHYRRMAGKEYARLQQNVDASRAAGQARVDDLNTRKAAYEEAGRDVPKSLEKAIENAETARDSAVKKADGVRQKFAQKHTEQMEKKLTSASETLSSIKSKVGTKPTREQKAELARAEETVNQLKQEVNAGRALSGRQDTAGRAELEKAQNQYQKAKAEHSKARQEWRDLDNEKSKLNPKNSDDAARIKEIETQQKHVNARVEEWASEEHTSGLKFKEARSARVQADPTHAATSMDREMQFNEEQKKSLTDRKVDLEREHAKAQSEARRIQGDPKASNADKKIAKEYADRIGNQIAEVNRAHDDVVRENNRLGEQASRIKKDASQIEAFRDSGNLGLRSDPSGLDANARISNRELVDGKRRLEKAIEQYDDVKKKIGKGGSQPEWDDQAQSRNNDARLKLERATQSRDDAISRNNSLSKQYAKTQEDLKGAKSAAAKDPSAANQKKVKQLESQLQETGKNWNKAHRDYRIANNDIKNAKAEYGVTRMEAVSEGASNFVGDYNRSYGETLDHNGNVKGKSFAAAVESFQSGAQTLITRDAQITHLEGQRNGLKNAVADAKRGGADPAALTKAQETQRNLDMRLDHAESRQIDDMNELRKNGHTVNQGDDGRLHVSTANPLVRGFVEKHVEGGKGSYAGAAGHVPEAQPYNPAWAASETASLSPDVATPGAGVNLPKSLSNSRAREKSNVGDHVLNGPAAPKGSPPASVPPPSGGGITGGKTAQAGQYTQTGSGKALNRLFGDPVTTDPPQAQPKNDVAEETPVKTGTTGTQAQDVEGQEKTAPSQRGPAKRSPPAPAAAPPPPRPKEYTIEQMRRRNSIAMDVIRTSRMMKIIERAQAKETDPEERQKNVERFAYLQEKKDTLIDQFDAVGEEKQETQEKEETQEKSVTTDPPVKPRSETVSTDPPVEVRAPVAATPLPPEKAKLTMTQIRQGNQVVRELVRVNKLIEIIERAQAKETDPEERIKNQERAAYLQEKKDKLIDKYDEVTGRKDAETERAGTTEKKPVLVSDVMYGGAELPPPEPKAPPPEWSDAEHVKDALRRIAEQDRRDMAQAGGETAPAENGEKALEDFKGIPKAENAEAEEEKEEDTKDIASTEVIEDEIRLDSSLEPRDPPAPAAPEWTDDTLDAAEKRVRQSLSDGVKVATSPASTGSKPKEGTEAETTTSPEKKADKAEEDTGDSETEPIGDENEAEPEPEADTRTAVIKDTSPVTPKVRPGPPPPPPPVKVKVASAPPPGLAPIVQSASTGAMVAGIPLGRWQMVQTVAAAAAKTTPGSPEWKALQGALRGLVAGVIQELADAYKAETVDVQKVDRAKELQMLSAVTALLSIPVFDTDATTTDGHPKRIFPTDPGPWINRMGLVAKSLEGIKGPEPLAPLMKSMFVALTGMKEMLKDFPEDASPALQRKLVEEIAGGYDFLASSSMITAGAENIKELVAGTPLENAGEDFIRETFEKQGVSAAAMGGRYHLAHGDAAAALESLNSVTPKTKEGQAMKARSTAEMLGTVEGLYGRLPEAQRKALGSVDQLHEKRRGALQKWMDTTASEAEMALAANALAADYANSGDRSKALSVLETAARKAPDNTALQAAKVRTEIMLPPEELTVSSLNQILGSVPAGQRGPALGAALGALSGHASLKTIATIQKAIDADAAFTPGQKAALKAQAGLAELDARQTRTPDKDNIAAQKKTAEETKKIVEAITDKETREFFKDQIAQRENALAISVSSRAKTAKALKSESATLAQLGGMAREALMNGQLDLAADSLIQRIERGKKESFNTEQYAFIRDAGNALTQVRAQLRDPTITEAQRKAGEEFVKRVEGAATEALNEKMREMMTSTRLTEDLKRDSEVMTQRLDTMRSLNKLNAQIRFGGMDPKAKSAAVSEEIRNLDTRITKMTDAIRTHKPYAEYSSSDFDSDTGRLLKKELATINYLRAKRDGLSDMQLDVGTSTRRPYSIGQTEIDRLSSREYEVQRIFQDLNGFHPGKGDTAWIEQRRRDGRIVGTREQLRMDKKTVGGSELTNLDKIMLNDQEGYQERRMAQLINEDPNLDKTSWRESWENVIKAEKGRRDKWGNPTFKLFANYSYSEERAEALAKDLARRQANGILNDLQSDREKFDSAVKNKDAQTAALILVEAREKNLAGQIDKYSKQMNQLGHQRDVSWAEQKWEAFKNVGQVTGQRIRFYGEEIGTSLERQTADMAKVHNALIRMAYNPIETLSQSDKDLLASRGFIKDGQYAMPESIILTPTSEKVEKFVEHSALDGVTSGAGVVKIGATVLLPGAAAGHLARGTMALRGLSMLGAGDKLSKLGTVVQLGIEAGYFTALNRGARLAVDPQTLEADDAWTMSGIGKEYLHNFGVMGALKIFGAGSQAGREALKNQATVAKVLAGTTKSAQVAQGAFVIGTGGATLIAEAGLLTGLSALGSQDSISKDDFAANVIMVTLLKAKPGKAEFSSESQQTYAAKQRARLEEAKVQETAKLKESKTEWGEEQAQRRLNEINEQLKVQQGIEKTLTREAAEAERQAQIKTLVKRGVRDGFDPQMVKDLQAFNNKYKRDLESARRALIRKDISSRQFDRFRDLHLAEQFMKKFNGDWDAAQKAYRNKEITKAELKSYTQLRKRQIDSLASEIVHDLNEMMAKQVANGEVPASGKPHEVNAFGSENVTSDYDLSFVGPNAELAVIIFNARWAARWGKTMLTGGGESAVRFDTNTYTDPIFKEFAGGEEDIRFQDMYANLAGKKYMTPERWKAYRAWVESHASEGIRRNVKKMMNEVERIHLDFEGRAESEIQRQLDGAELSGKSITREAADIAARNRLYEKSLREIISLKEQFRTASETEQAALKQKLRNAQSEALYFAAEAYFTRGAIDHVVMSIQAAKRPITTETLLAKGPPETGDIVITPEMGRQSYTEQIANMYKEVQHSHGEPKYAGKGAKYFVRAFDAAKFTGQDLNTPGMREVVKATVEIEAVRSEPDALRAKLNELYGPKGSDGKPARDPAKLSEADVKGYVEKYLSELARVEKELTAGIHFGQQMAAPSQRMFGPEAPAKPASELDLKIDRWDAEAKRPLDVGEASAEVTSPNKQDVFGTDLELIQQAKESGLPAERIRGIQVETRSDVNAQYRQIATESARAEGLEPVTLQQSMKWRGLATRLSNNAVTREEAASLREAMKQADARGEDFGEYLQKKGYVSAADGFTPLFSPVQVKAIEAFAQNGTATRAMGAGEKANLIADAYRNGTLRDLTLAELAENSIVQKENGSIGVDGGLFQRAIREAVQRGELFQETVDGNAQNALNQTMASPGTMKPPPRFRIDMSGAEIVTDPGATGPVNRPIDFSKIEALDAETVDVPVME